MMPSIAIPALVALALKLALLGYATQSPARNQTTRLFLALLIVLAAHNASEVLALYNFVNFGVPAMTTYGFAYVALLIPAVALILQLSLRLSFDLDAHDTRLRLQPLLYVPGAILLFLLLFTDQLVVGFQPFRNTVLRVPGPLYSYFETYMTVYLSAAIVNLIYGARAGRASAIRRTRNRLWLLAIAPTGLLLVYLIVANHFGLAKVTSTIYMPITLTFFLVVTAYATHEHRLFDIAFFIPWSKVRKRKTAFYRRIERTIAEIADLRSVREVLSAVADTLRCSISLVGSSRSMSVGANGSTVIGKFEREALNDVDRIIVADEIVEARPRLYALMKANHVAAIVPFRGYGAVRNWLLLGEQFTNEVYTPLDFRAAEVLFERVAERSLDKLTLLRSQLAEATKDLRIYRRQLDSALAELREMRGALSARETEVRELQARNAMRFDQRLSDVVHLSDSQVKTFDEHVEEFEKKIIRQALNDCHGNRSEAARMLGMRPNTLHYKLKRLGLLDKNQ